MRINLLLLFFGLLLLSCSCSKEEEIPQLDPPVVVPEANDDFIRGMDLSDYPKIMKSNPRFKDQNGVIKPFLQIIKEAGVNTVRVRLWVNPADEHSSFKEVKTYTKELKDLGFKVWLCIHYSDWWADPQKQNKPASWENIEYEQLKDSVYHYTFKAVSEMNPYMVQIGNEINHGLLWPTGNISNKANLIDLLNEGIKAVRDYSGAIKIMMHYAGYDGAEWFFNQLNSLDYDMIGLSYYPKWHGKSLNELISTLEKLASTHHKQMVIAETSYPFTLDWNDYTNNIIGSEEQLLDDFSPSPEGQKLFIQKMREIIEETTNGKGFCYWGAELIAYDGAQSTTGSPWENQAVFDFDNKALPVLDIYKKD